MRAYSKVCIGNVCCNFIQIILNAAEKNIEFRSCQWNCENYFCLLVMRTKTKRLDMWLWFCNCSCPKNLSPQQIRNQNIISPILAMWWWFGKNKIELSDLSCRWIRGERGEERRSKPVRRWRIVSPDPQIHEESLGAWFIWPRFIAL